MIENNTNNKVAQATETKTATKNSRQRNYKNTKKVSKPKEQTKAKDTDAVTKAGDGKNSVQEKTSANKTKRPQKDKQIKHYRRRNNHKTTKTPVRIISLGGLNEIGKNMTVYECGDDIIIVDCGLAFPDENMLGVDLVIPDFTYIEKNLDKVKGIFITHGHEDHIGGLAFLLKVANVPVYGTKLTIGLIEGKLKEHGLLGSVELNVVKARDIVKAGKLSVEFISVNHSIPDACAFAITTPAGVIIQTGDFKVDYTPIQGEIIDLARFGELGSKGVLALLSDSTNVEMPGTTKSESSVGDSFDMLFEKAGSRRIIVATFASNVHRVQQIVNCAHKFKRKVAVSGRSMENVVAKASELGYLDIPKGVLISLDDMHNYTDGQIVLITTGSQGEPMSALSRMSMGDHRKLSVTPNDYIIISARPIPGNEKLVDRVVNELMKQGAHVVYENMYEVHVSGHACQDEQRLMIGLTKPKFFIPVHGEYKHLTKHSLLAQGMGIDKKNIFISDIGKVMETDGVSMKFSGTVPAGSVMVDGLGVGDVGSIVLRDRKHLSEDGLIVIVATIDSVTGELIAGPDIISRGFVYVREADDMIREARRIAKEELDKCIQNNIKDWNTLKQHSKDAVSKYLYSKTKRKPMILPVIQEV